jgi:hypothetical protein
MITVEDIKNMTQNELEALVEAGMTELNQRRKVEVERAWTNFFEAAKNLFNLGEKIRVETCDEFEAAIVTIPSQFHRI